MTDFITAFRDIVDRYGDNPAIQDRGAVVSYASLWGQASSFAALLKERGIGREDVVALDLDKSASYLVGVIGCWMAGAAFMPLPPNLPEERRAAMLSEARVKYIYRGETCPMRDIVPVDLSPRGLAYLIYTSGSTGKPKGVMVEHAGLVPMLKDQIAAFGLWHGKRALLYLSIAFDASLSDIGTALLSGATLVIEDDADLRDAASFMRIMHEKKITHIDCPPSLLKLLDRDEMPESLETIIIGGEVCTPDIVRHWATKYALVNVYGPTEATICTSLCRCGTGWEQPLIGKPISDVAYHIHDEELYIESRGLARGYLDQPELTAQKFVVIDGRRLYKTGDRVMRRADGEIVFQGRIDRQFKLRGQLVEPEEVESVLLRDPGITAAAVLKRVLRDGMMHESLVAFVTGAVTEHAKKTLVSTLPNWMIPDHIEILPSLPRTVTGKPDFAALRKHTLTLAENRIDPDTLSPHERQLLALWRQVLKHDAIGLDDHFLKIGGDSLGVIALLLAAEKAGLKFSPGLLMLHPTIRQLAAALDGRDAATADRMTAASLLEKAKLSDEDESLITAAQKMQKDPVTMKQVLVTGATGSLGGRLVAELLDDGIGKIYCLVRAKDDAEAARRLYRKLGTDDVRIVALCGDVSEKQFGWDNAQWRGMSAEIDAVFHCAAMVNMVASFDDLAAANLEGTREVLRFTLTRKRKPLHYASTLSVFVATDQNKGRVYEEDRLDLTRDVYGGYAQTKWAAEKLLLSVPEDAADISCYRFGLVTGDSKTGAGADHDFLSLFMRGIISLGVLPPREWMDGLAVDITPIDAAAKGMRDLASGKPPGIYHLANKQPLSLVRFIDLLKKTGANLTEISREEWQKLPESRDLTMAESSAWLSLCRVLPDREFARLRSMDLFQATDIAFDMAQSGFTCPPPSDELILRYIRHVFASASVQKRICILGPESTGKSTLAQKLAAEIGGVVVPEFAEYYLREKNGEIAIADMPVIAAGQIAAEEEAMLSGKPVICDSSLMTTAIWSDYLFGSCPGWVRAEMMRRDYDLYLLCDIDVPFVADAHRYAPEARAAFMQKFEDMLNKTGRSYIKISGDWDRRFDTAYRAAKDIL